MRFKKEDGSAQSQFNIEFTLLNNEVRSTALNWSNVKLLVKAFGDDSLNWIGKQVRAWKTKSEKAKSGFSYMFVPTDWVRDDIGEWLDGNGQPIAVEKKEESVVSDEIINADDIPF